MERTRESNFGNSKQRSAEPKSMGSRFAALEEELEGVNTGEDVVGTKGEGKGLHKGT